MDPRLTVLADTAILDAKEQEARKVLPKKVGMKTQKQEQQCSQTKPRWSGKRYMIPAGVCLNCHRYGQLNTVCFSCKDSTLGAPKYLLISPPKKRPKRAKANPKAKQNNKAKLIAQRKAAAKEPFQLWLKNYCDVRKTHEHQRVQISVLFQSYHDFCVENDHERLMALRSKIQDLKFTANVLEFIRSKLDRKHSVQLMKDRGDLLCLPYIQLKSK